MTERAIRLLLGRPLASSEAEEVKIGVTAAIPAMGLDALGSAAYGPEAALAVLLLQYIGSPLYRTAFAWVLPTAVAVAAALAVAAADPLARARHGRRSR